MPGQPVFLGSQKTLGVKTQPSCLGVAPCQSQLCADCTLGGEAGLWFANPLHGFERQTQPNFCLKTFWGITFIPLFNYGSQIVGGSALLVGLGTLQLGDLGCWGKK